jgi:hypothetical protein
MTIKLTKIVEQVEEFDVVYAKNLKIGQICVIDDNLVQIYRVEINKTDYVHIEYRWPVRGILGGIYHKDTPIIVKIQ